MKLKKVDFNEFYNDYVKNYKIKYIADFNKQKEKFERADFDFYLSDKFNHEGGYYFVSFNGDENNPCYFIDGAREFWLEDFDELIDALNDCKICGTIGIMSKPFDDSLLELGFEMIDEVEEIETEVADYKNINSDVIYTDILGNGFMYDIEIKNTRRMEKRYNHNKVIYTKTI